MPATIKIKNSSTASAVPTSSDLVQGELAVNVTDRRLFTENASGTVVELGTNPTILTMGAAGSASAPVITRTGDTNTGIFFPAADTIAFAEGGTETLRLDSSGNMGLGVTPSAWSGGYKALNFQGGSFVSGSTTSVEIWANSFYNGTSSRYVNTGFATLYSQDAGQHRWYNAASGTAGNAITFTQAMTLDSSGRLGIGTTSPLATLAVSNGSSENIEFGSGNSTLNGGYIQYINRSTASTRPDMNYYLDSGGGAHKFYTGGSERARIDSSGNLLVGATSTLGSTAGVLIAASGANVQTLTTNSTSSSAYYIGRFYSGGTEKGYIYYNGSTVAFTSTSDYRLKEDVQPMTGALAKVAQLKPCTYTWKENGQAGQGFIAHELAEVVPDCVSGEKDAVDEDGTPRYQGIDTSFLVATLTAAIQELKAELDAAKARITALEA